MEEGEEAEEEDEEEAEEEDGEEEEESTSCSGSSKSVDADFFATTSFPKTSSTYLKTSCVVSPKETLGDTDGE